MSTNLIILIILLALNLIVALIYLILHLRKKDRKKGIINFLTFLVFPIVGFTFMGISELANLLFFQRRQRRLRYDELSFGKTRMNLVQDTDVDKSLDSVSLEEALMLSNKKDRRQSLMEVLKQDDYESMIGNIKGAVSSDDQEISHYAATFVSDTITRYKAREAELRRQMENNPTPDNLVIYIAYVREIMESNLFSQLEYGRYLVMLDSAAQKLYELAPAQLLDSNVTMLFKCWEKTGNEARMNVWLDVIKTRSTESLECFKEYAAFCFAREDRDSFFGLLGQVKKSGIVLDTEALEWIRYFA